MVPAAAGFAAASEPSATGAASDKGRLNASIESMYSDLAQTRPDLSYIPAK
jgi:hypothetical protein